MRKDHYRILICVFLMTFLVGGTAADARAVQQNATQTIRQLADKNNFHFGAAVGSYHFGDPKYVETLSREFNMLTPENEAKFCSVQPQQGKFDFSLLNKKKRRYLFSFDFEENSTGSFARFHFGGKDDKAKAL